MRTSIAITTSNSKTDKNNQEESSSGESVTHLVVGGATILGGVIGAVGGGLSGAQETYIFDRDSLNVKKTITIEQQKK